MYSSRFPHKEKQNNTYRDLWIHAKLLVLNINMLDLRLNWNISTETKKKVDNSYAYIYLIDALMREIILILTESYALKNPL